MIDCQHFFDLYRLLLIAVYVVSLIHVFIQSKNDKHVGYPIRHTLMVAIVLWPLGYLFWVLMWPGCLRQAIFGTDEEKAQKWAEKILNKQ
jgi:hypothetical protein